MDGRPFLAGAIFGGLLGGVAAALFTVIVMSAGGTRHGVTLTACESACERRGTEPLMVDADRALCVCETGAALRADYGRMFR